MPTFSKELLSGSTNGRFISVAATASPGTIIHTASSDSGVLDEIWLYATNTHSSAVLLTVEWGGTTNPDDRLLVAISSSVEPQLVVVMPGVPLAGGLIVRAFADTGDVVNVVGYVNRISP